MCESTFEGTVIDPVIFQREAVRLVLVARRKGLPRDLEGVLVRALESISYLRAKPWATRDNVFVSGPVAITTTKQNTLKVLCKRDAQLGKHTLLAGKIVTLNMIPGADVTLEIAGAQWTVTTAPKTRPIPIVYNPYGGFGEHVDDN